MKKLFYSLAAFALVATTACQESELTPGVVTGDYATLTINAKALSGVESKAALADYSDEALVYYLEVYKDDALYTDLGSSADGQFSTRLITGQEYTLVAWADHDKGYYNTENLTNVTIKDVATAYPAINTTDRDAFAGTETVTITENSTITFEITRPFARINVKTNDIADIPEGSGLRPTHVKLEYTETLYTAYNVLVGEVADDGVIGLTTAITAVIDSEGELSADYVFAPTEGGVAEFTAYYTADGTDVTSYTFSSIPYKRNYQTNISGNLLTKQGDITVTVNPVWEGEEDVYLSGTVSVATVEEANEFFESYAGTEDVNITIGVVDGAEAIEIPSTITSNVTFVIESAINEPVLVVTTEISGDVTIDNQSGTAMGLDVTAENASVYVKGSYNSISVASAPSTAYITEGAEVTETLTVNKGNVVLYGTVGSIVRGSENSDEVTTLYTYSCATVTSVEANDAITQEYLPYFAPGVTEIATSEFENNKVFTMVIIPEGIETIGTKAFYSTSIKAVYIPSTVEYVGEYSFSRCGSLEKIEVHAKEIGTGAFEQTNGTEIDDIIATSEIIGSSAFNGIHFEELVISGSVKEIYSAAFGYNSMLKKITIPATVEKLANSAFQHADNLEEVILEGSVPAEIIPSDCGTYANPFSSRYVVPINFYVPEGSESAYLEAWPKVWSYHYAYFLNGVAITAESFIDMEIAEIVNNSESGQVTISSVGTSTFALTIPESTTSEGQVIEIFIDSVTCDTELYINAADYNGKVKINLNDNGGFSVDLWLGSSSTSGDVIMGSGSWRNVYYGGTPSWYTNE